MRSPHMGQHHGSPVSDLPGRLIRRLGSKGAKRSTTEPLPPLHFDLRQFLVRMLPLVLSRLAGIRSVQRQAMHPGRDRLQGNYPPPLALTGAA